MSVPIQRQLDCAKRTVERERRRLNRLVATGQRVNRFAWEAELKNMEAIVETLDRQVALESVSEEMKLTEQERMRKACNGQPEWLSQALNEGDGVYRP